MTTQEREQYQARLREAKTEKEREQIRHEYQERMRERAHEHSGSN